MVATLTDAKRSAIAEKLADMRAIQKLIIANEQQFINDCKNNEIFGRLEDMLEDDQNNLKVLETTITQYGIQSEPKEKVKKMIEQAEQMMKSSELSLYEKMAQHELLKHGQVMSGLVVHKAAQIAGADVEEALSPLNSVNFENRAHQERLKGMLEYLGTQELTGEEPEQGVWGRVQDAVAAMTGAIGSAVTQTSDKSDMDIMDVIFMDHQKVKTLIGEIKGTNNPQRIQEFFGQLYKDVIVHAKAEEETVYPQIRSFYGDGDTQELYDEQEQLETILNEMKNLDPTSSEFKSNLKQVKDMIGDHTRQEESTMFASMRKNFSPEQREQMATQFKEAKQKLQSQM
ncbi:MAG: hemerythrin domain-containing protein [Coleofasciculus sp. C1-SOL-03]|uniref:hemerythrin domain-containing protein n=1 Tax=Coleofasciculus sp. C1-SOL-03 TaxID=3069522 RepID=UPI0032F87DC4